MKYLGLPLTKKKPHNRDFHNLVSLVQRRLEGWKANLLSFGGRVTLVKTVITAIPLHYMQAVMIPKGIVKQIDKMRRRFLWKGNEACKGFNCLVNWDRVYALKINGGMGVINLAVQNDALLLKWLWRINQEPHSNLTQILRQLHGIQEPNQLSTEGTHSFFLLSLGKLKPFMSCSIQDNEDGGPATWRWTSSGEFSSSSAYKRIHDSGAWCPYQRVLWKIKAPLKVIAFAWLLNRTGY